MNKFVVLIISACLTIPLSLAPIVCAAEGGETSLTLNKAIEPAISTADDNIYRGAGCQDISNTSRDKLLQRPLWLYDIAC